MGYSLQLYVVCAFAAIGGFCFGYDSGVISGNFSIPNQQIFNRYTMDVQRRCIGLLNIIENLMKIWFNLITDISKQVSWPCPLSSKRWLAVVNILLLFSNLSLLVCCWLVVSLVLSLLVSFLWINVLELKAKYMYPTRSTLWKTLS